MRIFHYITIVLNIFVKLTYRHCQYTISKYFSPIKTLILRFRKSRTKVTTKIWCLRYQIVKYGMWSYSINLLKDWKHTQSHILQNWECLRARYENVVTFLKCEKFLKNIWLFPLLVHAAKGQDLFFHCGVTSVKWDRELNPKICKQKSLHANMIKS